MGIKKEGRKKEGRKQGRNKRKNKGMKEGMKGKYSLYLKKIFCVYSRSQIKAEDTKNCVLIVMALRKLYRIYCIRMYSNSTQVPMMQFSWK